MESRPESQESVWDYPRPPRMELTSRHIQVLFGGVTIAETRRARRVLETSHPPSYYIPPEDVRWEYLQPEAQLGSLCEWKGAARYVDVAVGERTARRAGWFYPEPAPLFGALRDHVAFYAGLMDACLVDGERVRPQPGAFYGGWITRAVGGPFKGEPGTAHW